MVVVGIIRLSNIFSGIDIHINIDVCTLKINFDEILPVNAFHDREIDVFDGFGVGPCQRNVPVVLHWSFPREGTDHSDVMPSAGQLFDERPENHPVGEAEVR